MKKRVLKIFLTPNGDTKESIVHKLELMHKRKDVLRNNNEG